MARGVTLEQLLYNLRSEVGQSTNPAVSRSTRAGFISLMNRIQRRLYGDYEWPFLKIHRDVQMEAGSRYYDVPADIDMDRAVRFETKDGSIWKRMGYGITNEHYNQYDSDSDVRSSPAWRWDYHLEDGEDEPQFEVWPLPDLDGTEDTLENYVRVYGQQKLTDMVNDADTCLIDGDLIVLYAASEILAKRNSVDAKIKLENANTMYLKLKSRATPGTEPFKIGGDFFDCEREGRRQIELRVAYAGQEE